MLPAKLYTEKDFFRQYAGPKMAEWRILNAGSAGTRYGERCVNVDIQAKPGVDVVCDLHDLPESLGDFDVVVCNAALQYCEDPHRVAREFLRVLRPGGYLYVDAPWVQEYCVDTPDLFRYSGEGLRRIFRDFEVIECAPAIPAGSAFGMLGVHLARTMTNNRYVNFALGLLATAALYPFRSIRTARPSSTAGAFYLIARKPA